MEIHSNYNCYHKILISLKFVSTQIYEYMKNLCDNRNLLQQKLKVCKSSATDHWSATVYVDGMHNTIRYRIFSV